MMNPNKKNEELVDNHTEPSKQPSFTKWLTEITSSFNKSHIMTPKHRIFCFKDNKPEIPQNSSDIPSRLIHTDIYSLGEHDKRKQDLAKYGRRSIVTQMYFENTSRNISLTSSDYLVPKFEHIDFNELKSRDPHEVALENSWKSLNALQIQKNGKDSNLMETCH